LEISSAKANQAGHPLHHPLPVFGSKEASEEEKVTEEAGGGVELHIYIYIYIYIYTLRVADG
jgi:hypothetical protein